MVGVHTSGVCIVVFWSCPGSFGSKRPISLCTKTMVLTVNGQPAIHTSQLLHS